MSPEVRDYLSPPGTEPPAPFTLTDISDEAFAAAEIAVVIDYSVVGSNLADYSNATILAKGANLTGGLKITVGVEETPQAAGMAAGLNLLSFTGLRAVASQRSRPLWDASFPNRLVAQQVRREELGISQIANSTVTTVTAKVEALGFAKEDLLIRPDERHWFVRIQDTNSPPPKIPGVEYERPVACLDYFNITIGDIRYSSLVHPVFAAGFDVTADIAGRPCEVFQKVQKASKAEQSASLLGEVPETGKSYEEYTTTELYGIAGVIAVCFFEEWEDLISAGGIHSTLKEGRAVRDFLKGTGIWWIYYMETAYEGDYIDDYDMEWLLDVKVDNKLGTPRCCDHVFWWIASHGTHDGGEGCVVSSYSDGADYLTEGELLVQERKITLDGAYLFYWAEHCRGNYFESLWEQSYYHRNLFRIWYYDDTAFNDGEKEGHQIDAWIQHVKIGRSSCEDMFDDPTTQGRYYKLDRTGAWIKQKILWIKNAFETYHQNDDLMQEKTTSYEYYFVPPDRDWTLASDSPGARTRGEPCNNDPSETDWGWSTSGYVFETWETSGSSHKHYVGFYTTIQTKPAPNPYRYIWIEFDGRATSNYASSSVTNLYVIIYNSGWTQCIGDPWAFYAGGTTDTGWQRKNFTIELTPANNYVTYNVLFCYSDGWSWCWYQHIYVKNIALNWFCR